MSHVPFALGMRSSLPPTIHEAICVVFFADMWDFLGGESEAKYPGNILYR